MKSLFLNCSESESFFLYDITISGSLTRHRLSLFPFHALMSCYWKLNMPMKCKFNPAWVEMYLYSDRLCFIPNAEASLSPHPHWLMIKDHIDVSFQLSNSSLQSRQTAHGAHYIIRRPFFNLHLLLCFWISNKQLVKSCTWMDHTLLKPHAVKCLGFPNVILLTVQSPTCVWPSILKTGANLDFITLGSSCWPRHCFRQNSKQEIFYRKWASVACGWMTLSFLNP